MPIWLIELVGARDLDAAFLLITLMTAPCWIAMIVFPQARYVRRLAQPWIVVPLYTVVLVLLMWKSYQAALLPEVVSTASYEAARSFAKHPIAFLVLFCNLQIINLFMGVMIYQKAMRSGFRAPVELTLCCFLGALALIPFSLRLMLRRQAVL
ncbi:abscisic acid-deficient protein Aba4 family protein [Coraliomargarita algicola]|uniref:Abscisic acid-deficient protein Aba4 family protein n=1 Tax=Coraliomargarita algicola TaxID=3092156 RepID=A0ABZ0RG73_9BACT|nr:abscisic acid-deficient protein Aba4 family protein [Coraliomargarita sp. J2-16]WPJ95081.1 abscisic acid-deficient protein Aba4 family protein [Coraliomargarita sp. J2-16]